MKTLLFTTFIFLTTLTALAQKLPSLDNIKMTTKEDFRANDSVALQVATYVLSTPTDEKNPDRLRAAKFLIKWMGGTPDYTFELNANALKYFEKDLDLMTVYMASMTAYALQSKSKDSKAITLNGTKMFIAYIDNSSNNVKMTGKLKKLSEANQKGELESFLKL